MSTHLIFTVMVCLFVLVIVIKLWSDHREMKNERERLDQEHAAIRDLIRCTVNGNCYLDNVIHVDFVNKQRC